MKVMIINGSPHKDGCTVRGIKEMKTILQAEGVETVEIDVPADCPSCMACGYCKKQGNGCVRKDLVNDAVELFNACDGMIVASPVYFAGASGSLMSFLDRFFFSNHYPLNMKAACAFSSSRRAGNLTSNDMINKFFSISGMNIVTSTYWNDIHGSRKENVNEDEEGLQTLRNLARNLVYYLKMRELAKENGLKEPEIERKYHTNFVR